MNFSVAAPEAIGLELLIFSKANDPHPEEIIDLKAKHRSGDYWHVEVEGLGAGCCYAYRTIHQKGYGSKKILLDPCARAISGWDVYQRIDAHGESDNLHACLKGVVCERNQFDFKSHPRPKHPWNKSVIYELHVGGFTSRSASEVAPDRQGTFLGLTEKIPYLKDLGITTIELLPIFAFDPSDTPAGQENYWGYSPINWFTPHLNYIVDKEHLKARDQLRDLVAACHDMDIEVLLDVVYNHTTEGDQNGPLISWKGFGDSTYYHKNKSNQYLDVTGCGNTVAANRPLVRRLILESMRCWANELGVDGFRFDLGIALTRGEQLIPLSNPPLFEEIEADPLLSDLKLISEPWDCGGLYRLADFPAKRISTWNGHFRDDLRKFWKGDKNSTWNVKDRLRGSPDLYKDHQTSQNKSVNFITAHDGFTLNDLVSFNSKHNFSNGEENRDGENHNNSWNHGIEGPSTNTSLQSLRSRQQRNLLSSLILTPGIPMLLMGDEVSRSQGGNNNAWCQNSPLGWMIWDPEYCDISLQRFVRKLLLIRKQVPELFSPSVLPEEKISSEDVGKEVLWVQWHGVKLKKPDWSNWSHTISYSINQGSKGSVMWMGLNAYSKAMLFELPTPISTWTLILDTFKSSPDNSLINRPIPNQSVIELKSRSLIVALSREYASKIKL